MGQNIHVSCPKLQFFSSKYFRESSELGLTLDQNFVLQPGACVCIYPIVDNYESFLNLAYKKTPIYSILTVVLNIGISSLSVRDIGSPICNFVSFF
jgi:hypothetical protein